MKALNKYILILLAFGLTTTSCEDYLDINDNPNAVTEAPITSLLARTSFESGDNVQNVGGFTSFYVQYLASPNEASSTDIQEPVPYDQTWFEIYDVMTDLVILMENAEELGASNYFGVGKILHALNLGLLVDNWGDVPYSESFKLQTLKPAYDNDETLYTEIQTLLTDGIAAIESGDHEFIMGEDDFIYEGDLDKWVKMAHALKARFALHTGDYSTVLSEIDMAMDANDDDATTSYYPPNTINPWADEAIDNANLLLGGWISEQLIETMDGTLYGVVDPRMGYMYGTTDLGEFVGTVNGAGRGDAAEQGDRSTLVEGGYYTSQGSELQIISYAEQKFIEAEAAFRTSNMPRAYTAYLDGIAAHMTKIGAGDIEATTYMSDPAVAVGESNLTLELIFKEKYIAMFLHPETWNDARRFDYAYAGFDPPVNQNPALGGELIRRLIYPTSETGRNNVPEVDLLTPRIWWDQ